MAIVFIPAMLQPLTGGVSQMRVAGRTIRTIINNLEERFPGIKDRLLQDGDLRPDVAVAIDGETALDGVAEPVGEDSEVHFIPPISGGEGNQAHESGTGVVCTVPTSEQVLRALGREAVSRRWYRRAIVCLLLSILPQRRR